MAAGLRAPVTVLVTFLFVGPASAQVVLPPGFTTEVYVTGQGFDPSSERGVRGIPAASTLGFDPSGALYLARSGARFRQGDVEDLWSIYRIPAGGGKLTSDAEGRYFYGPPLRNPQIGAVRAPGEVFITTYDRDRKLGALYRTVDGRPMLFAGGTPPRGESPLFRQPEGVALDGSGHVYVADREEGRIVRLDATGKVLDARYLTVTRPRLLLFDEAGHLWIAGDGTAETPFQDGQGEIWKASPDGSLTLVLRGPLAAGMSLSPGGALFVVQRRTGKVFVVTPDGTRIDFASAGEGTILRGLGFAPVTPETRRGRIAGDLFLIAVPRSIWAINEILRVSGPFDEFVRRQHSR